MKKSELYSMLFEACNKLRGGVEPARYKDYVLILLFFKYVSDRYKDETFGEFQVEEGASFDDLIAIKIPPTSVNRPTSSSPSSSLQMACKALCLKFLSTTMMNLAAAKNSSTRYPVS